MKATTTTINLQRSQELPGCEILICYLPLRLLLQLKPDLDQYLYGTTSVGKQNMASIH